MDKINVALYGGKSIFGGRETALNADIVYCDKYNECTFYKKGKCFCAGRIGPNCKFGNKQNIQGYTSRAIKYNKFKRKYKEDECYSKLDEPNSKIGKIEDIFVINMRYLHEKEGGGYKVETSFLSGGLIYVPEKQFTNDLIKLICEGIPKTIIDNVPIKDYQEKDVPRFLYELKTEFKDIYDRFITEYPEYKDKEMNFIGRKAYIYSLRDGIELNDKTKFIKDGDYLKSIEDWHSVFIPFGAGQAELKIKIDKNMAVEITSNEMVDENTIFKD